jgi:rsbT co-antagonist protein RsbR
MKVWDGVVCMPLIGTVDSRRTADIMESLLQTIVAEEVRFAIVDLTGVAVVDTTTADHLIRLFKAAKLLGAEGILCGIQPAVAQTVVALGTELGNVITARTLADALKWCLTYTARRGEQRARYATANSTEQT